MDGIYTSQEQIIVPKEICEMQYEASCFIVDENRKNQLRNQSLDCQEEINEIFMGRF